MYQSPHYPIPLPVAPVWRRIAALVYDSLLLLALSMAYGGIALAIHVALFGTGSEEYQPRLTHPLFPIGWYVCLSSFYVFFWCRAGQTAGMKAWRLTIIGEENRRPSVKAAYTRAVLSSFLVPSFIAYVWAWLDKDKLCLHDRLSQTKVLLEPPRKKKDEK